MEYEGNIGFMSRKMIANFHVLDRYMAKNMI
jgi:hypothetical protein